MQEIPNSFCDRPLGLLTFPEQNIPVSPLILLQLEPHQKNELLSLAHIHPLLLDKGDNGQQAFYISDKQQTLHSG